jgi:hypothetical protein
MPIHGDYNICISATDSGFVPTLEDVSRLLDHLDGKMYLDGPDRDDSRLVILPSRETKEWQERLEAEKQQGLFGGGVATLTPLRKRYVNLLYSPAAPEELYRHYGQLAVMIDNLMPREVAFVASLGRGGRKLNELLDTRRNPEEKRWIQYSVAHILRGYHALWDRVWDEKAQTKVWELQAVKGFTFMLHCKLNSKADVVPLKDYIAQLAQKVEFQQFLVKIREYTGATSLEIIGEHTA